MADGNVASGGWDATERDAELIRSVRKGLFAALLEWLTGLAKSRTGTAGADAAAKPGPREWFDRRLAEWKAGRGKGER